MTRKIQKMLKLQDNICNKITLRFNQVEILNFNFDFPR